jgi:hypothetical protein
MKNTLSCRQAVRLMLEDEDREIAVDERVAIQVHVSVCFMCSRFVNQLNFMRRATRAWRRHSGSSDA